MIDDIDGVDESAVIGLPHQDFGEATAAVVVAKHDAKLDAEAIVDALKSDLAGFKTPKKFTLLMNCHETPWEKCKKIYSEIATKIHFWTKKSSLLP